MKPNPFFSIIIPTLNEEVLLPHLLKDLKNQTFSQDFEVVVVDAKSTDKTQSIIKNHNYRLIISNKKNVGHQRNLGAKAARGKYLLFIDADARIPLYFLDGIKYHLSRTNAKVFSTWAKQDSNNASDKAIIIFVNLMLETAKNTNLQVAFGTMIGCQKSTFNSVKGFDPKITFAEDAQFVQKIRKKGVKYHIFKDPKYTFSLRRFRKEGTLPAIRTTAKLGINRLINGYPKEIQKDYQMLGGSFYEQSTTPKSKISNYFNKALDKIKNIKPKYKLEKIIEDLFTN
jgi:glycosyltransferase involved in cell wall biosynthesis